MSEPTSKLYRIEREEVGVVGAGITYRVNLIGEVIVGGFPTFEAASTWLREFILAVLSNQLTAMVAAAKVQGRDS